jgi:hypothetical protein
MNQEKIEKIMSSNHPYGRGTDFSPIVRIYPKVPRNTICPFTKKKFKKCCGETGQNFCEKAKDSLRDYLTKMIPNKKNEETQTTQDPKKE